MSVCPSNLYLYFIVVVVDSISTVGRSGAENLRRRDGDPRADVFIFGFTSWVNSILVPYFKIGCELNHADDKIPMRALEVQLKRLKGEYLLRELATSGVLPGYGFPTDITTLRNTQQGLKGDSEAA